MDTSCYYCFLLAIAKLLGQRSISQLRLIDFAITLVIGNIIAHPLSDEKLGLEGSIITTLVLVILYICGVFITLKFPSLRRLVDSPPITIVQNGEILHDGLKKARISIDVLLEELREEKVDDIKKSPKGDLEWLTPLLFVITIFVVKICITIRTYQNWHAFGFMVLYCSIFIIQFLNNLLIHLHIFLELLLRIYILNNDSCTSCPVLFHLSGNKTLLLESFSFPSL